MDAGPYFATAEDCENAIPVKFQNFYIKQILSFVFFRIEKLDLLLPQQ